MYYVFDAMNGEPVLTSWRELWRTENAALCIFSQLWLQSAIINSMNEQFDSRKKKEKKIMLQACF